MISWLAAWAMLAGAPAFTVGIELPSQVPPPAFLERALADLGVGYVGFYVDNGVDGQVAPAEITKELAALCRRLGLRFSLDSHHRDPGVEALAQARAEGEAYSGVLVDELEHVRLLFPEFAGPNPSPRLADSATFTDLFDAEAKTEAGFRRLAEAFAAAGAPRVVATHVWPSLLHCAARAGWTPCPKICKEFYSPVSLAVGLGAALQYGRELWVDVDMWHFAAVPGHPPDEVLANLQFAYWMGADLVYLEGCGYNLYPAGRQGLPFALLNPVQDHLYQLTPHGEMLRWFCTEYLPAQPRPWTFRDIRPTVAVIRFDDTDVGQPAWGADRLYGSPALRSDQDTRAWLALWNVLTHGATGNDGIAWFKPSVPHPAANPRYHLELTPSYLSDPAHLAHRFFVPLDGVVVFDDRVGYDRLRDIPLLVATGKRLTEPTRDALRRRVAEGATGLVWGPLAATLGLDWHAGTVSTPHGAGRWVLTDDFESPEVAAALEPFLGSPDAIRYRFGDRTLTLGRVAGDNGITVAITDDAPAAAPAAPPGGAR